MASDEQKKINLLRLSNLTLLSLATSVWDMLGETSFVFGKDMGQTVLNVMEKEMGLEIAGETPENVMMEISRIFVDEFGYASDIDIETSDNTFVLKVHNSVNYNFNNSLLKAGVEKPFTSPLMNACEAAMDRLGFKMHENVEQWPEGKGTIITYKKI